jgi:hypothetical protein
MHSIRWRALALSGGLALAGCGADDDSALLTPAEGSMAGSAASTGGAPDSAQGGQEPATQTGGSSQVSETGGASMVGGAGPVGTGGGMQPAEGGTSPSGGASASPSTGVSPGAGGANSGGTASGGQNTGGMATGGVAGGSASGGTGTASGGTGTASGGTGAASGGASGGAAGQGGGTAGSGAAGQSLPARVCDEPAPWAAPASERVVGSGTAASCTASALREAVAGGGYVTFNCGEAPVSITISSAIEVGQETVVDGGAGNITLDGGGTSQIFIAQDNTSLSVRNLRFINGRAPASEESDGIGGAVAGKWRSAVEVRGCTFEDNTAGRGGGAVAVWTGSSLTIVASRFMRNSSFYGGAVYSLLSPLTVVNSEFVDNDTIDNGWAEGGAIGTDGASEYTDDGAGGTIEICGTQIRNNHGLNSGGAVYIWMYPPDVVTIDRTTLEENSIGGSGLGGAMRISNGEIIIKNSSFLSNTSDNHGGALYLDCTPTCTITNCTFYGNQAGSWGGAISTGTPVNMNNVTFADNAQGTGDNALFGSGPWTLHNSIFLNNGCATAGTGAHVLQQGGSGSCISGAISGDPMLAAPADNGGPTFTMLPGAGSAALQAGANCEPVDQRGEPRDVSVCDLGAVEVP